MNHINVIRAHKFGWYHSSKPLTKDEQQMLISKFGFYEHHVVGTQQGKTPRPKISVNKKYIYIVLHLPYQPSNSNKFYISDINIFLTKDNLVTVESQGNLPALQKYFETAQQSKRITDRRLKHGTTNLLLNLLKYLLEDLELILDHQGELVDALNKKIFQTHHAAEFIEEISVLRYNQVVAASAMDRQSRMLEARQSDKNPLRQFSKTSDNKWGEVVETFQTLAYELKADIDHLEGLVQTFETLVTHKTNETIKLLTIVSVVLLPLTLMAGIFGMNFKALPFGSHPFGFGIIMILMIVVLLAMLALVKWRKWL